MMTLGYVIVGILLGFTLLVALGFTLGLWGAVSAARPELMERGSAEDDDSTPPG